jgi:hypothetical protein
LKETIQKLIVTNNAATAAANTNTQQSESFVHGSSNGYAHNIPKMNPNLLNELKRNFSNTSNSDAVDSVTTYMNGENSRHHQYQHAPQHAYNYNLNGAYHINRAYPDQQDQTTSMTSSTGSSSAMHMLNNDLSKFKSSLIKKGSLANRHLPQPQQPVNQRTVYVTSTTNSQDEETDTTTTATTATTNDGDEFAHEYIVDEMEDEYVRHPASLAGVGLSNNGSIEFRVNLKSHNLNGIDMTPVQQQMQPAPQLQLDDFMFHPNTAPVPSFLITSTTKKTVSSMISTSTGGQLPVMYGAGMQAPVSSFMQPVEEWSCESVAQWLAINDLGEYVDAFLDKDVDGEELLHLDSSKLKVSSNISENKHNQT